MKVKIISKADLRKVQGNQEKRQYQDYLRESETQTKTGLIAASFLCFFARRRKEPPERVVHEGRNYFYNILMEVHSWLVFQVLIYQGKNVSKSA